MFGIDQNDWIAIGLIVLGILGVLTCVSAYQTEVHAGRIEAKIDKILDSLGIK
jgi:hypothetical protein